LSLPSDAALVGLTTGTMTFRTRECLLPGTMVSFTLVLEGRALTLAAPVGACLVMARDKAGFTYHVLCDLNAMPSGDRQLVALFVTKGRGSPQLQPAPAASTAARR
jgi:hypothetical protein